MNFKKLLFLLLICNIPAYGQEQHKNLLVTSGVFFLEESFLYEDSYLRDPVMMKCDGGKVDYKKGIYMNRNYMGMLGPYGWDKPIDWNDTLERCYNNILRSKKDTLLGTFKFSKLMLTIKYYYLGLYKLPVPKYPFRERKSFDERNYIYQEVPVYIIEEILK